MWLHHQPTELQVEVNFKKKFLIRYIIVKLQKTKHTEKP